MSAELAVRAAVIAALRADAMLMAGLNGLYDGEPVRASAPYGHVGDCIGTEWGGTQANSGWRIVTARLVRSRVMRSGGRPPSGWQAVIDYRLRVVWEGG